MAEKKEVLNIYQRVHAVMSELKNVTKESKKVNGQFRYISFNKVYEDVKPLFIKHGVVNTIDAVAYQQDGNMGTLTAMVSFINIDNPEDKIEGKWVGQGISGNRNGSADDKSIGKALSYLHKNAICKLLLLGGSEDEEVDKVAKSEHKSKAQLQQQMQPQPQMQQPVMQQPQMSQPQQNFNPFAQ